MKHVLLPLITIPVLLLSACSSRPVSVADAKPAPQARVFKYQTSAPTTLVVAKLETGEKATFHLDAGQWIVGASLEGAGLCALNPARQERETITKAGETKVFRVFTSNAGDIDILPTTL